MSRGMHLGHPTYVSFTNYLRTFAYDGAAFVWAVESKQPALYENLLDGCTLHAMSWFADYDSLETIKDESAWKIQKRKSFDIPVPKDLLIPQNMVILNNKIYFSLNTVVKSYNYLTEELFNIAKADTPDGYDTETFSSIGVFDIATELYTEIATPVTMKSNISVVGDSLYFGSKWIEDDINDSPKIYRLNTATGVWDSCILTGIKKQRERLNTFSNFKNSKLFVPLWNDFRVAVVDTSSFTLLGTVQSNGYPSSGIYTDEDKAYFTSFAGMLSQINVDSNVITSELGTGGVGKNLRNSLAFEHGTTKIWFAKEGDFGRIDTSTKEVISFKDAGKDYGILKNSTADTVNLQYQEKNTYAATQLGLANIYDFEVISTPKFIRTYIDANNVEQQMTVYSRLFIKSDKYITMFNTRDVEFVFDYNLAEPPASTASYISSNMIVGGNAMVGSGDTDYIGEFFL